jgi:hypothetical protein
LSTPKSKQMPKKLKALPGKEFKPRGRNGGRRATVSEDDRKEQANVKLPRWLNKALRNLVPVATDRNNLFAAWARAYVVANGESDRLLAQSSVAGELLNYLEASDAPLELINKLESVIVTRDSDEVRLEQGVKVGDSYIVG